MWVIKLNSHGIINEQNSSFYLSSGDHVTDYSNYNFSGTTYPTKLYRKKIRSEFILSNFDFVTEEPLNCTTQIYPIFVMGPFSLNMNTIWFKPTPESPCQRGASYLTAEASMVIDTYLGITHNYTLTRKILFQLPYFISFSGETVTLGPASTLECYDDTTPYRSYYWSFNKVYS